MPRRLGCGPDQGRRFHRPRGRPRRRSRSRAAAPRRRAAGRGRGGIDASVIFRRRRRGPGSGCWTSPRSRAPSGGGVTVDVDVDVTEPGAEGAAVVIPTSSQPLLPTAARQRRTRPSEYSRGRHRAVAAPWDQVLQAVLAALPQRRRHPGRTRWRARCARLDEAPLASTLCRPGAGNRGRSIALAPPADDGQPGTAQPTRRHRRNWGTAGRDRTDRIGETAPRERLKRALELATVGPKAAAHKLADNIVAIDVKRSARHHRRVRALLGPQRPAGPRHLWCSYGCATSLPRAGSRG